MKKKKKNNNSKNASSIAECSPVSESSSAQAAAPVVPEHLQELDLLSKYRSAVMGFAALWIFIFHEWQTLFVSGTTLAEVEYFIKRIGFCGVDIFLLLSGIGLTFSIEKTNLPTFYYRRLKRVILPFLTMGCIRCVLENWTMDVFWKNLTGFNFYAKSIYSFLWFVPAIITLYLLFPFFYRFFSASSKPVLFLVLSLEIWFICSLAVRETMRGDLFGFTNRIPIFLIGICIGWIAKNRKVSFALTTWCMLLVTFILGLYLEYLTNYKGLYLLVPSSNCCMSSAMIAVSLPFLLAKLLDLLCRKSASIGGGLTKVLSSFGTISLEFYCVQEYFSGKLIPVLQERQMAPVLINLVTLLCVTATSFCAYFIFTQFWKLAEMPISEKKPARQQM